MQSKNVYPFITLLLISWLYYLKHTTFANQGRDINKSVIKGYIVRSRVRISLKPDIPLLPSPKDLVPQKHGGEKTTRHLKTSHPI